MRAVTVSVSYGEAADKISILEIKQARIADAHKRANVARELALLTAAFDGALPPAFKPAPPPSPAPASSAAPFDAPSSAIALDALRARLKAVNETLWDIEDDIRLHEARGDFGGGFVRLARAVYTTNDERARLKREIDALLGSELVEEKSYGG